MMAEFRLLVPEKQLWNQDVPIYVSTIHRFADAHDIYADELSNPISEHLRAAADSLESNFGAEAIQLGATEEDRLTGLLTNLCFDMEIHNQALKDMFHNLVTQPDGDDDDDDEENDDEAEDTASG
jgi:hypothetical protein